MKVYIAGPMSGYEDFNRPAFYAVEEKLQELGYDVFNPAKVRIDGGEWIHYMRFDIARLMECDAVYFMDGWEESRGANIERYLADKLGIPTLEL